MTAIKGVIFDFNGTMVFDSSIHRAVWRDFIPQHLGIEITDEQVDRTMLGRDNANIVRQYFGELPEAEVTRLGKEKEAEYRRRCLLLPDVFKLVDGVVPFLDHLKQRGMPMTIATGSDFENVSFYFEHFGLDRWFDFDRVVYDDCTFPGKPSPDVYLLAAERLGLAPADCLVFEDSFSGIRAAHNAGIGHVAALSQVSPAPDCECSGGVDAVLYDFTHAAELFAL